MDQYSTNADLLQTDLFRLIQKITTKQTECTESICEIQIRGH